MNFGSLKQFLELNQLKNDLRCSSHGWRRCWGPAMPEGKGEGEAQATMHGGSAYRGSGDSTLGVARSSGGEAVRRPGTARTVSVGSWEAAA
jgi:hypothetical protein